MTPPDLMTLVLAELREIRKDVGEIKVIQGQHHSVLEEHIRRTVALEIGIEAHHARFRPLENHISAWGGVGKALTVFSLLGGLAVAAWKLWGGG